MTAAKESKGLLILLALALVLSLGIMAMPMAGTVEAVVGPSEVWVDDDWTGPGDCGGHSWNVDAFATIQEGIDAVATGGTVNVADGTYNENPSIDKSVTLLGAQSNVEPVAGGGARAGGESTISGGITITGDNTIINGFEITDVKYGIACGIERSLHQNVSILYNYIHLTDGSAVGINLMTTSPPGGVDIVTFRGFLLSHNYIGLSTSNRCGIGLNEAAPDMNKSYIYDGLEISYNEITTPSAMSVWSTPPPDKDFTLTNPVLKYNHVHDSDRGFYIANMYNADINNNIFEDGKYCGCQLIILGGTVSNNVFQDFHPSPAASSFGLMLLGTATGHPTGSRDVLVTENDFYYNNAGDKPEHGTLIHTGCDVPTIQVTHNNFYNGSARTDALALKNYTAGTDLDAELNWWDDASGPCNVASNPDGLGGAVTDDVDFEPWLMSAWPDTNTGQTNTKEVVGSGTVASGDTAGGIGTIGIDASGNHTITTASYAENPGGAFAYGTQDKFYDVHMDDESGVTSLTVNFCPATAEDCIYYWDGNDWVAASQQEYNDAIGCITVTITSDTTPCLVDLSGLPFAQGSAIPVGGEAYSVSKFDLVIPLIAMGIAAVIGTMLVTRQRQTVS